MLDIHLSFQFYFSFYLYTG